MKTKILGGIAIVAIAVAVAFNVSVSNQKQDKASMLALANVEALADGESSLNPGWWLCPGTGWKCPSNSYGQTEYDFALLILL